MANIAAVSSLFIPRSDLESLGFKSVHVTHAIIITCVIVVRIKTRREG